MRAPRRPRTRASTRADAASSPGSWIRHTHLVFAGDRGDEFAARMAGEPYVAGGIKVTTDATRAATTDELLALARARVAEARRCGITHLEIKSGYGLEVETERRICEVAAALTDDVTFLGAHLVPREWAESADGYVDLVCGEMLAACAPYARWIDVFCETGAFDAASVAPGARRRPRSRARPARTRQPARLRRRRAAGLSSWARRRSTTARFSPTPTSTPSPPLTPSPRFCPRPTSRPASPTPMRGA